MVCGQFLTLKNYWSNQIEGGDPEVYCHTHVPRIGGSGLDSEALGIKRAVAVQQVREDTIVIDSEHGFCRGNEDSRGIENRKSRKKYFPWKKSTSILFSMEIKMICECKLKIQN